MSWKYEHNNINVPSILLTAQTDNGHARHYLFILMLLSQVKLITLLSWEKKGPIPRDNKIIYHEKKISKVHSPVKLQLD